MEKYTQNTPLGTMARVETALAKAGAGPRYIIETPNQLWRVCSYDGAYPVYLSNYYPQRDPHVFRDLSTAKEALTLFWHLRGGAKLRVYQLADDGQRVEVKA